MEIATIIEEDYILIEVRGELDASSAIYLDQEIEQSLKKDKNRVIVSCQNLEYISSAGLGVFISYLKEFQARGIVFVIYGMSEKVQNVFQILGLDNLVNISTSKEEAISGEFE